MEPSKVAISIRRDRILGSQNCQGFIGMALSMSANPQLPSISVGREGVIVFRTSCPGTRATLSPSRNAILSRPGLSAVSESEFRRPALSLKLASLVGYL